MFDTYSKASNGKVVRGGESGITINAKNIAKYSKRMLSLHNNPIAEVSISNENGEIYTYTINVSLFPEILNSAKTIQNESNRTINLRLNLISTNLILN